MFEISDITLPVVESTNYDISFFSCGYETRCTHLVQKLDQKLLGEKVVLSFLENKDLFSRKDNELLYQSLGFDTVYAESGYKSGFISRLHTFYEQSTTDVKILVDYSSMTKLWISSFVSWMNIIKPNINIVIDFVYNAAMHNNAFSPLKIRHIKPLPLFEGIIDPHLESIAFFGLGFDPISPLSVLDCLEPDQVYTFYANPGVRASYPHQALKENKNLIENYSHEPISVPIHNIGLTYSILCEYISTFIPDHNICIIPMGPKPLTLASLLACCKFGQLTFLNISGERDQYPEAPPSNISYCTRITKAAIRRT